MWRGRPARGRGSVPLPRAGKMPARQRARRPHHNFQSSRSSSFVEGHSEIKKCHSGRGEESRSEPGRLNQKDGSEIPAEFALSELRGFFAALRMTSEGPGMTVHFSESGGPCKPPFSIHNSSATFGESPFLLFYWLLGVTVLPSNSPGSFLKVWG